MLLLMLKAEIDAQFSLYFHRGETFADYRVLIEHKECQFSDFYVRKYTAGVDAEGYVRAILNNCAKLV